MISRVYKYRNFIVRVIYLTLKYSIIVRVFSSRRLIQIVSYQTNEARIQRFVPALMQPKQRLIRLTDKIINSLPFNSECLVRSLVKRDILCLYGYKESINLGILKEDEQLKAHAWIGETDIKNFVKVY